MADIANRKPSEKTIDITDPGRPDFKIGVKVTLMAISDERMKSAKRRITDRRIHMEQRDKHFTAADLDKNAKMIAFSAMIDWQWTADDDGEPVTFKGEVPAFNETKVFEVFDELPWFLSQVQEALNDEKDFFGK